LTGKRTFEGETVTETLSAILKSEPDWHALPATTPPNIRFLLRRCLEKEMSRGFQNATDVRIVIGEAGSSLLPQEARAPARSAWNAVALVLVGVILAAAIGGVALWSLLKSRLSFHWKYQGKSLYLAFAEGETWYLYPHDELPAQVLPTIGSTQSWQEDGAYSFPSLSNDMGTLLEPYRISGNTSPIPEQK
jgi:hypothetical protein